MPDVLSRREQGRGERVLPGLFRLRLPLPWPGVPHCNAWAVASGDGFVLFDTEAVSARRLEIARQSGVPEEPLRRYAAERSTRGSGIAGPIEPDRDLVTGMGIVTDLGEWIVYETPGHAPSHVCLFQPERRLLVSGDHLLGRISLYFDYGYSPDPVGEFLSSLDVAERLGARLCLAGHGRTFTDVHAHIQGNRALVQERLQAVRQALAGGPLTVFEIVPHVYGDSLSQQNAHWLLSKILCYLTHLQTLGEVRRIAGEPERWAA